MTKKVKIEITPEEIACYICEDITIKDFTKLLECCGEVKNTDFFMQLWNWVEWDKLNSNGRNFLKILKEELNKMNLN